VSSSQPTPAQDRKAEFEWALSVLLQATRTTKRGVDLVTASRALAIAREALGGLKAVADRVGLSEQMLRDFACVEELCAAVRKMYAEKRLTSVDVAVRLSRLPRSEQLTVAREHLAGRLTSKQVRDVVSLRRRNRELSIQDAIGRVRDSADVRTYIIRFPVGPCVPSTSELRGRFSRIVGKGNILSIEVKEDIGILAITPRGEKRLRAEARERATTARGLVESVLEEGRNR